jgi:hypothetical protein
MNIQINTSVESIRDKVFAMTGVSMKFKRYLTEAYVDKRNGMRQEREERESETSRALTMAVLKLGDSFTSLSQLPPELVATAGPSTLASLTSAAQSNKQSKPIAPAVAVQMGYLEAFNPKTFADPKTQAWMLEKGVPPSMVTSLASKAGATMGAEDRQPQPDPIPRSRLEELAKPAFQLAGIDLWGEEAKGPEAKKAEKLEDLAKKQRVLGFLEQAATRWAADPANKGKTPDQATMKGWIGAALLASPRGPVSTLDDSQLVTTMSHNDRRAIRVALEREGKIGPNTPASEIIRMTADLYRRNLIATSSKYR